MSHKKRPHERTPDKSFTGIRQMTDACEQALRSRNLKPGDEVIAYVDWSCRTTCCHAKTALLALAYAAKRLGLVLRAKTFACDPVECRIIGEKDLCKGNVKNNLESALKGLLPSYAPSGLEDTMLEMHNGERKSENYPFPVIVSNLLITPIRKRKRRPKEFLWLAVSWDLYDPFLISGGDLDDFAREMRIAGINLWPRLICPQTMKPKPAPWDGPAKEKNHDPN